MKTHLIIPPSGYIAQRWKEHNTMPPLGILFIAAMLEKNNLPVKITASDVLKLKKNDILREIRKYDADAIGMSITTENRFEIFDLLKTIKNEFPKKQLIVGGPHATMAGLDMVTQIPAIDLAVIGEGERTILEVAAWHAAGADPHELAKIKGIIYKHDGQPIFTGPRPMIENLDPLPFPAKHLIPMDHYDFLWPVNGKMLRATNMITSRGCPFNCNFCPTPFTWGRHVRGYSPQRVVDEIRWNRDQFGAEVLWFFDDTFNYHIKRTEELCRLIIKEKMGIRFVAEVRIDILSYDLLALMREAGVQYISFGVEAGSERVRRDIIHKNISNTQVFQTVDWARQLGIKATAFFIFSHPTETWAEAKESLSIIEQIKDKADITVSILHIYPGTELETYAKEKKLLPADFSWNKLDRRVETLPAAQGDIPLFKDQFTWAQIGELVLKWSIGTQRVSLWKKIPDVLRSIRSGRDIWKYLVIGLVYMRIRLFRK
ncbi:MAG: B12-binding domain-containing radical SAM protein [Candidatus Aminicenantes bacterium]|nr:B12-binding domain-containing radical SAM protein [Candidatus Aminicenantes bacterium]